MNVGPLARVREVALALSMLGGVVLAAPAEASDGFRCPTTRRLIANGDSLYEVRRKCREPDDATQRVEYRTVRERVRQIRNGVWVELEQDRTVEVVVDEWTYDFGTSHFIRYLRFEQGRLVSTREGDYGGE